MANDLFLQSATDFSLFIEQKSVETGLTHLETILEFCNEHSIDPDDIAVKITKSLKSKLEIDFQNLNYLPKRAQLDL